MNWLTALIEALLKFFSPKPAPPTPVPSTPTTTTTPPPVVQAKRITKDTPFREVPMISEQRFKEILAGFPMESEAEAIHAAVGGRALPLAQSYMESSYGKSENALKTRNALGLMDYTGKHPVVMVNGTLPLRKFNTWAEGFAEWARRMDDLTYPGGGG